MSCPLAEVPAPPRTLRSVTKPRITCTGLFSWAGRQTVRWAYSEGQWYSAVVLHVKARTRHGAVVKLMKALSDELQDNGLTAGVTKVVDMVTIAEE